MAIETTERPHLINKQKFFRIDKELVMVFSMVVIVWLIHYLGINQYALLSIFFLPVLFASYFFGKQHGTLSAILAVIMIFVLARYVPETFVELGGDLLLDKWSSLLLWGGVLVVTGFSMGSLYEKKEETIDELNTTYQGIITMLSLVIDSVDRYTQSHSYRVSIYSEKIGQAMALPKGVIEELHIAALLHDLGKIGVSEQVLNKVGKLDNTELNEMSSHTTKGKEILEPLGPRVSRILPLVLSHHERHDGKGYNGMIGRAVPVGARVIAVADVYDALTTDRPYRKALTPRDGLREIKSGSGTQFDPEVVEAFTMVFEDFIAAEPSIRNPMEGLEVDSPALQVDLLS